MSNHEKFGVEQPLTDNVHPTDRLNRLPEGALTSHARRENYLEILHQIVSYVEPLRRVLESAYSNPAQEDWRAACQEISHRLAKQIEQETPSVEARRAVRDVAQGSARWSTLSDYSDDHPLMDLYINMRGVIESLEARAKAVQALPEGDLALVSARWSGYGRMGLEHVHRTPFGLEVYYNPLQARPRPRSFDGAFNDNNGVIIILSQKPTLKAQILRHERIHALLAGACDFQTALQVEDCKKIFNTLISQMNRRVDSQRGFNRFQKLFHPAVVVDMTHEELLAQLHNAMDLLAYGGEDEYSTVLSTAGHFIDSLTEHLVAQSEKVKNPAYQSAITRTAGDITALFAKQVTALRQALFVAGQISSEQTRAIEALAIALLPSQWHHLNSYLDHRIGTEVTRPLQNAFTILECRVEAGERERQILRDVHPDRLESHYRDRRTLILRDG